MLRAIDKLIKSLPLEALKAFTSDRGKEFDCYEDVKKRGINFYFANAYSTRQRRNNKNSNGLLKKCYPKKAHLSKISIN